MASAAAGLVVPLAAWFLPVSRTVPQPYLDEVFHVRQAQEFCHGRFHVWDPKITTPPGLYLVSYLLSAFVGCSINALRASNMLSLILILLLSYYSYRQRVSVHKVFPMGHCALNCALFPPLFFFSALYYTDIAATFSVLLFYTQFVAYYHERNTSWRSKTMLVIHGVVSLLFRQTNIFWVAIFPAALILVHELDRGHAVIKDSMYRGVGGFGDSMYSVAKTSWKLDVIYDAPVQNGWLEDFFKTSLSVIVCALKTATRPARTVALLKALSPFIALLSLFAAFIFWNGGVVLGDRSNHITTMHLTQMLYIWPYITFFSWPIICPYLLLIPATLMAKLRLILPPETLLIFRRRDLLPRLWLVTALAATASIIVHYNTLVHPFTLADNRHYTFYVFRLLLHPWWMRYAVTPVYIICGWASIQALGGASTRKPPNRNTPQQKRADLSHEDANNSCLLLPNGVESATTSFVLIWLATTSLQLITAPLVEPRYFILPWLFWRLHVPHTVPSQERKAGSSPSSIFSNLTQEDPRLFLESVWFIVVNALTGYVFLNSGFAWAQEPDSVQRFMW